VNAEAARHGVAAGRRWIVPYGYAGIALVALAWAVSWAGPRPFRDEAFFPLWLGYIVTLDAVVKARSGRSLFSAGPARAARLFATSAAVWWLFEVFNLRTDNWHYTHAAPVSPLRFAVEASISFSTVLPAVLITAALWSSVLPGSRSTVRDPTRLPVPLGVASLALGAVLFTLTMLWPHYFFPGVWLCLFFLVDPVNALLGRRSLLADAIAGRWRLVFVLALAGLTCGFFWEMWNVFSMPKWTYSVPLVPQQRLFEMPLLGYSGYIPFAFECFAVYTLLAEPKPGRGPAAGRTIRGPEGLLD
jgi:hypothetical protein